MRTNLLKTFLPGSAVLHASVWSLLGNVVPMIAAMAAVPFLLRSLGAERMGVLSLVWVFVGYFNFLDLGLGRAVTVAVARCRSGVGVNRQQEIAIVGTAATLLGCLGLAAVLGLAGAVSLWGLPVKSSLPALDDEIERAFMWMLPSMPLLLLSAVLRGHLEAIGAFRALNLLRMPAGVLLVAAPCLVTLIRPDLAWVCASILMVRLWQLVALLRLLARAIELSGWTFVQAMVQEWNPIWLRSLLTFGGWVSVSNVLGPVIVYADRFAIGALVTAGAVAVYAIPFDVLSRLPVLTASLATVLLPEIARLSVHGTTNGVVGSETERSLVWKSYAFSLIALLPILALGLVCMPWFLGHWIDADFSAQASAPAQVLLVAFVVTALAQIPFAALQACGKVRTVAILHAVEMGPYLGLLWLATTQWGVLGAAFACLARSCCDFLALVWLYHRPAATP